MQQDIISNTGKAWPSCLHLKVQEDSQALVLLICGLVNEVSGTPHDGPLEGQSRRKSVTNMGTGCLRMTTTSSGQQAYMLQSKTTMAAGS